jgi:inorganic triphosphatase YgiF
METELKFEVGARVADKLCDHILVADGDGRRQALRSIYFDTPEFDLRAAGVALRVREADGRRVQTIKQAGGDLITRGEWETEVETMAPDFGATLDTPLDDALPRADRDRLGPVFEVRVDRAERRIQVGEGVVEMALDRGQVHAGGRDSPVCELELELKSGAPAAVFDLARSLSGDAILDLAFTSKAERGYALLDGGPLAARTAGATVLDRKGDAAQAFRAIAANALTQIADNARILRQARRPEAVHQLRIGLRRLRSALSLFKPMLAGDDLQAVKGELKWMTRELDEARDLDVFIAHTFRRAARDRHSAPGLAAFGQSLLSAQTRAYDQVEAAVHSARFRGLMLETVAWIEIGPWASLDDPAQAAVRGQPVMTFAAELFDKRRRKIDRKAEKLEKLDAEARHKLRIDAKGLRYACEFFASLYDGKAAKRNAAFGGALADLQDSLGALNDIAVSEGLAARVVGAGGAAAGGRSRGDLQRAFAAGAIAGQARPRQAKLMKAARKARDAVAGAPGFWD